MQMAAHGLMFASLNVLVSTVAFIPLMLTSAVFYFLHADGRARPDVCVTQRACEL
jgi:hypothetical protein